MDLTCPSCGSGTSVPDDLLPPEGARARCQSCQAVSVYYRGGLVADDPTPARGTVAPAVPAPPHAPLASAGAGAPARSIGWQIRTAAGDQGPLPLDALKPMIRDGRLGPDDLACAPGATEWIRAADAVELQRWFALQKKAGARSGGGAAPASDTAPCWQHPGTRGRWMCGTCGTLSCDACVLTEEMARVPVKLCPKCRKLCQELVVTKEITPFWKEIPRLLAFPVARGGWIALLLCWVVGTGAVIAGASPIMGGFSRRFLTLCIYAYHLAIIRTTSSGARSVPHLGNVSDIWGEMVWPGLRAAFVSLVVFVPSILVGIFWLAPAEVGSAVATSMAEEATQTRIAWEKWKEEEAKRPRTSESADWNSDEGGAGADPAGSSFDPSDMLAGLPVNPGAAVGAVEGSEGRSNDDEEDGWTWFDPDTDYAVLERQAASDAARARSSLATARIGFGLAFAFSLAIWPVFLIVVALFNTIMPAFQPQVVFRLISEIPREYAWCAAITSTCWVVVALLGWPLSHVPVFNNWQASPLTYYFTFVAFHVMGRTAELAERKLDWH